MESELNLDRMMAFYLLQFPFLLMPMGKYGSAMKR